LKYKKIAIVGSGISGLGVAHSLQGQADITLLEAGSYFGGHANTVECDGYDYFGFALFGEQHRGGQRRCGDEASGDFK
jgi:predicted NAD/FAD-binding protein